MFFRASIAGGADLFELHRRQPAAYPFLLQSVAGTGRYDILFAQPGEKLSATDESFFSHLNAQAAAQTISSESELPFAGGWFVYLGYELAGRIEPAVRCPASPHRLPDAFAVRCAGAVIYDHLRKSIELVAEDVAGLTRLKNDAKDLNRIPDVLSPLPPGEGRVRGALRRTIDPHPPLSRRPLPEGEASLHAAKLLLSCLVETCDEERPQQFTDGVSRILEYLAAGDVFQVNLSRGWRAQLKPDFSYQDVYRQLRQSNPAPFAGLAVWDGCALLSSSPERLVEVRGRQVQTRPIAGTHPRDPNPELDAQLRARLLASFKERAEHIMLLDLERNDLGRVCEPGSIEVDDLMQIESYAHVHHLVSNVRGRLRTTAGPGDVLRAVFPGGTITGCPKVRAMQIIAELETVGRGPYTGAMGYLSRDGRMDMNILIRSMVCDGRDVSFRTGAGIVSDSKPADELAETRAKARGLLMALGINP